MYSSNKIQNNGMIKIKKRNYLSEKKEKLYMDKEIKSGAIMNEKIQEVWRGKHNQLYENSYPEEKYMLNEILKKYQSNKDQLKGFNYKYILELTDLLGQKDKNFSKKRLELYNNRIHNIKKQYSNKNEKYLLKSYKKAYNVSNKPNHKTDLFNKKNQMTFMTNFNGDIKNNKNKTYNSFYNKRNKNNNYNFANMNSNKYIEIYNKTSYNYNSPLRVASLKFLLSNPKSKSSRREHLKNINKNLESNFTSSFYLTQYNMNNDDSFDTTSLVGKEDFLISGDREKYHEYLQKEYKFFDVPRLRQIKFLLDKQKRIKLFKKMPNAKYLNYRREDPLKTEIFRKIKREKNKTYFGFVKDITKNEKKSRLPGIVTKPNNKLNFYNECQKILSNLKKNLK